MGGLFNLATVGVKLTMFIVLFILITLAVIWILDRITGINRSFGIGRFYSKLPSCRDKHGKVELGQLAENIDRLADYLKDRSNARIGSGTVPDSVEYRLAADLAELAKCARTMQAFMDKNASALLNFLPLIVARSARQQRFLSAPPVQPEGDWSPDEYRHPGAQKATAYNP